MHLKPTLRARLKRKNIRTNKQERTELGVATVVCVSVLASVCACVEIYLQDCTGWFSIRKIFVGYKTQILK